MEFDSEAALVQLIEVLGNTLARLQATQAKEEYELEHIVASIKFVNRTVHDRNKPSQEPDPNSPDSVHVYEPDMFEVSKSIDAILDEARAVRSASKSSANSKEPSSTPRDAETQARKPKAAAVPKKKMERVTQPVRRRPKKRVSSLEDAVRSSVPAAKEMLLRWMENKKGGSWIDKDVERRQTFDRNITQKLNSEKRFLDSLWSIRSIAPDSSTNVEDCAAGADYEMSRKEKDDAKSTGLYEQLQRETKRLLEMNCEMSQADWNLMNERHLKERRLQPGQEYSFMDKEKESAVDDDCWLSAEICEKVLGTELMGDVSMPGTQEVPTVKYTDIKEVLKFTEVMHSIHSNIFNCYLQSVLADSLLSPSSPLATKSGEDVINNPRLYLLFRLAHCLVCNDGKSLLTIARRVEVTS